MNASLYIFVLSNSYRFGYNFVVFIGSGVLLVSILFFRSCDGVLIELNESKPKQSETTTFKAFITRHNLGPQDTVV